MGGLVRWALVCGLWCTLVPSVQGQIPIDESDFFTTGDSYTVNSLPQAGPCVTSSIPGVIGSPGFNNWDFTIYDSLLTDTYRHDYVTPDTGGFGGGALFPGANFAQRRTNEVTGDVEQYLYLSQNAAGRTVHGFYLVGTMPQPEAQFMPPDVDFPFPFTFGDSWSFNTEYQQTLDVLGTPVDTISSVSSNISCDGWGTITLPNLGTVDCVRVMELQTTTVFVDLFGTGTYSPLETITVRSYGWYANGFDEVARITSQGYTAMASIGSPCPVGTPPVDFSSEVQAFQVQIANSGPSLPPTIGTVDDQVIPQTDVPWSTPIDASGFPAPTLSVVSGPAGLVFIGTDLTWTPTDSDLGSYMVTIEAENPAGTAMASFMIDVVNLDDAPQNLEVVAATSSSVELSWSPPSPATLVASYQVSKSTTPGGPYSVVGSVGSGLTTLSDPSPVAGAPAYYIVTAELDSGSALYTSDPSNEAFAYVPTADESVLLVDDGSAEDGAIVGGANSELAVGYDLPSSNPLTLTKILVFIQTDNGAPITLKMYDDDMGASPGSSLGQFSFLTSQVGPGWNVFAVPAPLQPTFMGGSFFVGVVESGNDNEVGIDTSTAGHSWTKLSGGAWSFLSSGEFMIRAIVEGDGGTGGGPMFIRGDANADGGVDIADAIYTLGNLFSGGPSTCLRAMDANADNGVDIADAIFTLASLFSGGDAPSAPYPGCGTAMGTLSCDAFPACP